MEEKVNDIITLFCDQITQHAQFIAVVTHSWLINILRAHPRTYYEPRPHMQALTSRLLLSVLDVCSDDIEMYLFEPT